MTLSLVRSALPRDHETAALVGRVAVRGRPVPVRLRDGQLFDLSSKVPTMADLLDRPDASDLAGTPLCSVDELCPPGGDGPVLLSPIDLQCVKACGVTFAVSAIERVIEERARGDQQRAADLRAALEQRVGDGIRAVVPGSEAAQRLKAALIDAGLWSQYLEVAIGPDAEVFTKAAVLSTVGWGDAVGIRSDSQWNNPEPEVVLAINSAGTAVGATLGNDVNLRDFEGRSALLLGKAKDNNASCALGPFIRLFDGHFTMDDVRTAELELLIEGADGYRLEGRSSMREISRDPLELVRQSLSEHQYPDGLVLFLGTLFAPVQDRDTAGHGFTHKVGDRVTIHSERLGTLVNMVTTSDRAAPWTFGIRALMASIAQTGARA